MTASKTDLNPKVYRVLLGRTLPTVIHSEEQNERYIEILAGIAAKNYRRKSGNSPAFSRF